MSFGLRKKLFGGFGLIILIFAASGIIGIAYMGFVVDSLEQTLNHPLVVNRASQDMEAIILSMQRNMYGITLTHDKEKADQIVSEISEKEAHALGMISLMQKSMLENDGKRMALNIRLHFYQWRPIRDRAITLAMIGKYNEAQDINFTVGDSYVQKLQSELDGVSEYATKRANRFTEYSMVQASKAKWVGFISIFLSIVISILISFFISVSVTRKLRSIRLATTLMAKGDLNQKLEIKGTDEFAQVASNFNAMARELSGMYSDLEKKVEVRTRELLETNEELQRVKEELEVKVNERTRDLEEKISELNRSQLAMLYMVEDLNDTARKLKSTQEELIRKERLAILGEFSGNISHELRNPLGVIDSSIYYLQMRLENPDEKISQHLGRISQSVKNATNIIENLLNLTRMNKPLLSSFNLTTLLSECLKTCPVPPDVNLVCNFAHGEIIVKAEQEQMRMVVDNLVKNAVAAMNGHGTLTIQTRTNDNREAEFSVSDSGEGILQENKGKVFLPLFTTKAKGIGLGLSITKMIVENHKGTITVESEPEKGATFIIRMPLVSGMDIE